MQVNVVRNGMRVVLFVDVDESFEYGMIHTTRHNSFLHRILYNSGKPVQKGHPMRSYYEYERDNLENIVSYEVISGISFSPVIVGREICKDYAKENKNVLELPAFDDTHYNVYILVNPKGNEKLYEDLKKHEMDSYIMECDKFEIVVGVHVQKGISSTAISDFTGMYISTHPNKGVDDFRPLNV